MLNITMVTRAGKKLLKNTIRRIDYHNRVLEEQDMWRQWELQQGLTMMVSDNTLYSDSNYLNSAIDLHKSEKFNSEQENVALKLQKKDVKSLKKMRHYWLNELMKVEEKDPDRWGHSGYKELYPEEFGLPRTSKHPSNEKWSHSGYKELYPEEFGLPKTSKNISNEKYRAKEKYRKRIKKRKKTIQETCSKNSELSEKSNRKTTSSDSESSRTTSSDKALSKNNDEIKLMNKFYEIQQKTSEVLKKINISNKKKRKKMEKTDQYLHTKCNKYNKHYKTNCRKHKRHKKEKLSDSSDNSVEEIWIEKTADENNSTEYTDHSSSISELSNIASSTTNIVS